VSEPGMNAACVTTQQSARLTHEGPGLAKKPSLRYTSTARGIDSDVQLSSLVKQPMYTHNHWPTGQCALLFTCPEGPYTMLMRMIISVL